MPYCFTLLQKSNQSIEKAERAIERETKEEKKIKKNYHDKKKKQKKSHRNISKLEKETPQKEIWNKGGIAAKGAFGRNWRGNRSEERK